MSDTLEELIQRHKKEKKELQGKIQNLKHTTPKGDKKKKKDVTAEITKLESELNLKQEKELSELQSSQIVAEPEDHSFVQNGGIEEAIENIKISKSQRKRDKKALKDKERNERIAEAEIENLKGVRHVEKVKIESELKSKGLSIFEVPSDGNCMYKALEHQLSLQDRLVSTETLRSEAAFFMRKHPDDFMPFMTNPDSGEPLTLEEFENFCQKTESSTAWGGQIELRALSHSLETPIEVVQAEGAEILIGEEYEDKEKLILSYHRHAFKSGEHYNSVIPLSSEELDMEENDFVKEV